MRLARTGALWKPCPDALVLLRILEVDNLPDFGHGPVSSTVAEARPALQNGVPPFLLATFPG